jgi:putative oxidoreductase
MSAPVRLQRAVGFGLKAAALLAFAPPLLARISLGHAFFLTGQGKLANFENTVSFFTELGIPMPALNAAVVSRLEYYGAILLVVGVLTRLTAALLASTMAVALLTADRQAFLSSWLPSGEAGPMDIAPWVFLMLLSWLVIHGPGLVSLDAIVARWLRPQPDTAPAPAPQ